MPRGGIFVINEVINEFYVAISKTVMGDRLRMAHSGNFVIMLHKDNDVSVHDRLRSLR